MNPVDMHLNACSWPVPASQIVVVAISFLLFFTGCETETVSTEVPDDDTEVGQEPGSGPLVDTGLSRVEITPEEPIRLTGYGSRRVPSEGIAQPLWAKGLAVGSDEEEPVVMITVDLLGVPGDLVDRLSERLDQERGVPRSRLVVAATHTHTGPEVEGIIPNLFGEEMPEEHRETVKEYTQQLEEFLLQVALEALDTREPTRLDWTQGEVSFAVNRRVIRNGQWTGFGVNHEGPVDHDLPVLAMTTAGGSLRGLLVNYACHCTTLGDGFNEIHGDWAGEAQAVLEERHNDLTAMIAIGAGADANPEPRTNPDYVSAHGNAIADEVDRLLDRGDWRPLNGPPETRLEWIDLPYDADHIPDRQGWEQRKEEDGAVGLQAQRMIERLDRGEEIPTSLSYPIQTWVFDTVLAKIFLAGEVVVDYSLRLKQELDGNRLWVNAYSNDAACYIPSSRLIGEGGYEVDLSMVYYDRPARFSTEVEEMIIEAVHQQLPDHFRSADE